MTYLVIKEPKTSDKGQIPTFSITFPPTPLQCNWLELGKPTRGGARRALGAVHIPEEMRVNPLKENRTNITEKPVYATFEHR